MANDQKIAIIGLGYVGLPLAVEFGKKYKTIGFDINSERVFELSNGNDSTNEVPAKELNETLKNGFLTISSNLQELKVCNIFIVTVPTPIDQFKSPDLGPLISASKMIGTILKKEDIVIYESTVYPGCTEEDCVPVLEKYSSLIYNKDFFCGYSPERINPGDKINTLTKIKKVTSGSNPMIAKIVDVLYKSIITAGTHLAPSIKVAEASKAIENAQRDINISFVNELALIFDRMNIDTHDVLEAAGTKWNFLKYQPGLVGGHCIGVDPYYLAHKAESVGYHPHLILSGRRINDAIGKFVAEKVIKLMINRSKVIKGARLLLLGITFKENCPDIRNSKVIDIYKELIQYGFNIEIYDPIADPNEVYQVHNIKLVTKIESYDAIILAVSHNLFLDLDYLNLKKEKDSVIYDIKSILDRNIVDGRL
jgi:UDP-N-acetyl-D-galactosamine dehydrogenase